MRTLPIALRLKQFRRRFGITAPRLAIKRHICWQWYALVLSGLVLTVAGFVWSIARQGGVGELTQELRGLRTEIAERNEELTRLRAGAATEHSAVQMERSAQQQLASRIRALERENAGLKEDISVFERLVKDCPRKIGQAKRN